MRLLAQLKANYRSNDEKQREGGPEDKRNNQRGETERNGKEDDQRREEEESRSMSKDKAVDTLMVDITPCVQLPKGKLFP